MDITPQIKVDVSLHGAVGLSNEQGRFKQKRGLFNYKNGYEKEEILVMDPDDVFDWD